MELTFPAKPLKAKKTRSELKVLNKINLNSVAA